MANNFNDANNRYRSPARRRIARGSPPPLRARRAPDPNRGDRVQVPAAALNALRRQLNRQLRLFQANPMSPTTPSLKKNAPVRRYNNNNDNNNGKDETKKTQKTKTTRARRLVL